MELSRRSFLKRGLVFGGGAVGAASGTAFAAQEPKKPYKLRNVKEVTNICCYCSGGCGTDLLVARRRTHQPRRRPGPSGQPRGPVLEGRRDVGPA